MAKIEKKDFHPKIWEGWTISLLNRETVPL
jgi:hypothetical protein